MFDARALRGSLVDYGLKFDLNASTISAVGGYDHFTLSIIDAVPNRVSRKATEDDRMRRSDASARKHRHSQGGHQRHIESNTITAYYTKLFQDICEPANFRMQLLICQCLDLAGFTFPDYRRFVLSPG